MKITFLAYGTRGDVQPAIALGKTLHARGHRVKLVASPNFTAWIERHGLEPAPSRVDVAEAMNSPSGQDWIEHGNNPVKQLRVMRRLLVEYGSQMIQDAWAASQDADALLSQFTSVVYTGSIAARLGIPHACVLLQPSLLATRDGRAMISAPFPRRASWFNYWFGKTLVEPAGWQIYGDKTNQFRREVLGMPPLNTRRFVREFSATSTLMAYSPHVAPQPADWPKHFHTTGYFFLDEDADWQPPRDLAEFLAAGEPPVYVGFGSMTGTNANAITQVVVKAVVRAGQRAMLLSGWAGLGNIPLPPSIFRVEAVPHAWLFPRVRAVVHHGGAGTTAEALRAGVPQVIIPHLADQPFWGRRMADLGVSPKPIPRPRLTASRLAEAIREAATNEAMLARARTLAVLIRAEDGLSRAADLLETYWARGEWN